jgi:hypothetical protein
VTLVVTVSPEFTAKYQAGEIIQQTATSVGGKLDNARGGGKHAASWTRCWRRRKRSCNLLRFQNISVASLLARDRFFVWFLWGKSNNFSLARNELLKLNLLASSWLRNCACFSPGWVTP